MIMMAPVNNNRSIPNRPMPAPGEEVAWQNQSSQSSQTSRRRPRASSIAEYRQQVQEAQNDYNRRLNEYYRQLEAYQQTVNQMMANPRYVPVDDEPKEVDPLALQMEDNVRRAMNMEIVRQQNWTARGVKTSMTNFFNNGFLDEFSAMMLGGGPQAMAPSGPLGPNSGLAPNARQEFDQFFEALGKDFGQNLTGGGNSSFNPFGIQGGPNTLDQLRNLQGQGLSGPDLLTQFARAGSGGSRPRQPSLPSNRQPGGSAPRRSVSR